MKKDKTHYNKCPFCQKSIHVTVDWLFVNHNISKGVKCQGSHYPHDGNLTKPVPQTGNTKPLGG